MPRKPTKFTAALIEEATVAPFFRALWTMKRRMPALPPNERAQAA